MRATPIVGLILSLIAALSWRPPIAATHAPGQNDFAPRVQPLDSPAASNSGQPQLTVSARGVLLSWIERDGARATLKFSERTPAGWSDARIVASGDNWFVNWADVPSVLRLADDTLAAHWLQKSGPSTYAYDVRLSVSKDGGLTWSPSFLPHSDGTQSEHGFASLFGMAGGGLGLVWLDGRAMHSSSHDTAASSANGAMMLRFGAFDRNWKQTTDSPVDMRVCECCPTTAAMTADGPIVAFRNRTDQDIRDIYVSRLEQGKWSEPQPVANDGWHITGCPVNGPMLAARGRTVVVAWFTGKDNQNRAFGAFSQDAGRTFGAPIRLDDNGTLGRVDVELLDDGSAVASWIEYSAPSTQFRIRRVEASGARSAAVTVAPLTSGRSSGYPRLARHGNELVMAWVEGASLPATGRDGAPRVKTAVAQLPRVGR
ncbi:MAG TPA: sialidase family protein [Vicinamibacterales bacterium]|nr:sialidase family protein [Vicinamibacterales bacterium]